MGAAHHKKYKIMGQYKILIAILCLLLNTVSYLQAQPNKDKYRDKIWITGYESQTHSAAHPESGVSFTDFSTDPPVGQFVNTH